MTSKQCSWNGIQRVPQTRWFAPAILMLLAAEPAAAWFPVDPLHGFSTPVTLSLRVHRRQITGGGSILPFNGSSQYLNLGNDAILNVSSHDFTAESWVQFNAVGGEMSLLDKMSSGAAADADGWRLYKTSENRFRFCLANPSGGCRTDDGASVQSYTTATTGPWFHVVGRKTAGSLSIFVNGRAESTIALGPFIDTGQADLLVGRSLAQGAFLNGSIDTVGLYARALKASQIRGLYQQASRAHQPDPLPTTSTADLQAGTANASSDSAAGSALTVRSVAGQLFFSKTADRSDPRPLDGTSVSGSLYAFTTPNTDVRQVKFWLDDATPGAPGGSPLTIEYLAPFDLIGTSPSGEALPFDTRTLTAGPHTVSAEITLSSGVVLPVVTATFGIAP